MTDIAVIGFAQSPTERHSASTTNGVELLVPLFLDVLAETGLDRRDVGFWCSGSSDYLAGRAFSFVSAVDAIGAFPPIVESHVEMDGAWALYEAYVKLLTGDADTAVAYGFGKSSAGDLRRILALQLDPYLVTPLWPDSVGIAGLQARLCLEAGLCTEREMAEVAARSRARAMADPSAQLAGDVTADELLAEPYLAEPFRHIAEQLLQVRGTHHEICHLQQGFVAAKFGVRFEVAVGYQLREHLPKKIPPRVHCFPVQQIFVLYQTNICSPCDKQCA